MGETNERIIKGKMKNSFSTFCQVSGKAQIACGMWMWSGYGMKRMRTEQKWDVRKNAKQQRQIVAIFRVGIIIIVNYKMESTVAAVI